jgi:5'-phosphate synthase pdxT subunit
MRGIFIRAPWIEESGPSVEILADHGGHPVAARDATRIVAAFHPELTDDRRLHRLFVDGVREAVTEHKEDRVVGSQ